MEMNFLVSGLAALIPLVVGLIWYTPSVFGKIWLKESGMTEEKTKGMNMFLIFGLTLILSLFITFVLFPCVIHQYAIVQVTQHHADDPQVQAAAQQLLKLVGNEFRTFKHGALHGGLLGVMLALPIVSINALFERKSWKYILINAGFWIVSLALMGGVLCALW
jgi:hypothetical protein